MFVCSRFNITNIEEPSFFLINLEEINAKLIEENDSVFVAIYAVNQKGKSIGVVIHDMVLGVSVILDRGE